MKSGTWPVDALRLLKKDIRENAAGLAAVTVYIFAFQLLFHTICPMQLLFGLPCPGCGLTRALLLLLKGDFGGAFRMHPFLFALAGLALCWAFCRYILQRTPRWLLFAAVSVFAGMVVFYIYRMYMYFPHTEPMNRLTDGFFGRLFAIS